MVAQQHGRQHLGISTKCGSLEQYEHFVKQYVEGECPGKVKIKMNTKKDMMLATPTGGMVGSGEVFEDRDIRVVHRVEAHQTVKVERKWKEPVEGKKNEFTEKTRTDKVVADHVFYFDVSSALSDERKAKLEEHAGVIRIPRPTVRPK